MRSSSFILILLVLSEALILGGAAFAIGRIASGAWDAGSDPQEVVRRIGTVAGGAAPVVGIFLAAIYVVLRRQGR